MSGRRSKFAGYTPLQAVRSAAAQARLLADSLDAVEAMDGMTDEGAADAARMLDRFPRDIADLLEAAKDGAR